MELNSYQLNERKKEMSKPKIFKGTKCVVLGNTIILFICIHSLALGEAIIAVHRAVSQFDRIPDQWIETAK